MWDWLLTLVINALGIRVPGSYRLPPMSPSPKTPFLENHTSAEFTSSSKPNFEPKNPTRAAAGKSCHSHVTSDAVRLHAGVWKETPRHPISSTEFGNRQKLAKFVWQAGEWNMWTGVEQRNAAKIIWSDENRWCVATLAGCLCACSPHTHTHPRSATRSAQWSEYWYPSDNVQKEKAFLTFLSIVRCQKRYRAWFCNQQHKHNGPRKSGGSCPCAGLL